MHRENFSGGTRAAGGDGLEGGAVRGPQRERNYEEEESRCSDGRCHGRHDIDDRMQRQQLRRGGAGHQQD